ncbi:MAG: hypothetical protein WC578_00425 [Candidatus Omnitrophota bacterium]|jgi:hypothetical protein
MENKLKDKWYFKSTSLVIGFLLVGPFILPLIWTNPGFTNKKKVVLTTIILVLSCLLFVMAAGSLKYLTDSYRQLNSVTF